MADDGRDASWRCPGCSRLLGDSELTGLTSRPRLKVLLVDDEKLVVQATASMLGEIDAVTVSSGKEALDLISRMHFDVVVSDVRMPEMTGPELFVNVCARFPELSERFLLLSGDADSALQMCRTVMRRAGVVGAPRILEKPVPRDELVRCLVELGSRGARSGTFAIGGVQSTRGIDPNWRSGTR